MHTLVIPYDFHLFWFCQCKVRLLFLFYQVYMMDVNLHEYLQTYVHNLQGEWEVISGFFVILFKRAAAHISYAKSFYLLLYLVISIKWHAINFPTPNKSHRKIKLNNLTYEHFEKSCHRNDFSEGEWKEIVRFEAIKINLIVKLWLWYLAFDNLQFSKTVKLSILL